LNSRHLVGFLEPSNEVLVHLSARFLNSFRELGRHLTVMMMGRMSEIDTNQTEMVTSPHGFSA
jgi:hypothetical protein